jgi:hypothetical protein
MKQWQDEYPVKAMAKVLEVSRSGYHAWLGRPPSERAREDERLKVAIRAAHEKTRRVYGAARLQAELEAEGFDVGRGRVARLRRETGIRCLQKRKSRPRPTRTTGCRWRTTCQARCSKPKPLTRPGTPTSPASRPAKAGSTWRA